MGNGNIYGWLGSKDTKKNGKGCLKRIRRKEERRVNLQFPSKKNHTAVVSTAVPALLISTNFNMGGSRGRRISSGSMASPLSVKRANFGTPVRVCLKNKVDDIPEEHM